MYVNLILENYNDWLVETGFVKLNIARGKSIALDGQNFSTSFLRPQTMYSIFRVLFAYC